MSDQWTQIILDKIDDVRDSITEIKISQAQLKTNSDNHEARDSDRHQEVCERLDLYNEELKVHIMGVQTAQARLDVAQAQLSAFEKAITPIITERANEKAVAAHYKKTQKTIKLVAGTITGLAGLIAAITAIWNYFF